MSVPVSSRHEGRDAPLFPPRRAALEPWTLSEALAHPAPVKPGDTIWLLDGVYRGAFTSVLRGTAAAPIVVRQAPGARATIDGGASNGQAVLGVGGAYTWYWGFEVMSSDPKRQSRGDSSWAEDIARGEGVQIVQTPGSGVGVKLIGLVIHDTRQGISFWSEAENAEAHGCLIFNNGWDGATGRGHGHGIYVQNRAGKKRIENNVIFDQFGGGIVAYGSEKASLDNLEIVGNTVFNSGALSAHGDDRNLLVGGGRVARGAVIEDNATYYRKGPGNNLGYDAGCRDAVVRRNVFASGGEGPAVHMVKCADGLRMEANTFVGGVNGMSPPRGNRVVSRPSGSYVMARKDAYEKGRAVITVFNWDRAATVTFDPRELLSPGASFEIKNAADWFGPSVLSGTYRGGPLVLPMTGLGVAPPIGWKAPAPTGPEFNVFVLLQPEPRPEPIAVAPAPSPTAKPGRKKR
jgi:hypothetical protein